MFLLAKAPVLWTVDTSKTLDQKTSKLMKRKTPKKINHGVKVNTKKLERQRMEKFSPVLNGMGKR